MRVFLGAALYLALLVVAVPALAIEGHPTRDVAALLGDDVPPPEARGELPDDVRQVFWEDAPADDEAPPADEGNPGFSARIRDAFGPEMFWAGFASLAATALGVTGFAMVTRYISPKEALKNPQRAMLYGFIKATPGAHLKQLSEEFAMKTSSILWHIRKLEAADLVKSERANGFRVFYPVAGGIEAKRLSRAITALQNENARAIHALIDRRDGLPVKEIGERLNVHVGTVRWHVRKLREFGLVEELVREDGSLFYATPLGRKALEAMEGMPTGPRPSVTGAPTK